MRKKLLLLISMSCALFLGFGFTQSLSNDNKDSNDGEIYSNLYQNEMYTHSWTGYTKGSCDISESSVIKISEFSGGGLAENTIYILDTEKIAIDKSIILGNCTAIIGSGTLIDNSVLSGDVFVITGRYSIIDNIQISGINKDGQYGIKIMNTDSVTLHNIKIDGLYGGIYSHNSNYSIYDGIQIHGIGDYSFYLENSSFNDISNLKSSNNEYEGLNLENSSSNSLINIELFNNSFQGLYLGNSSNNIISQLMAYGNGDAGILINSGGNNILSGIKSFFNTNDGILVSSSQNKVDGILSHQNANGIEINGNNNSINNYYTYNNNIDGIFIKGYNTIFNSGLIYNNKKNGIELENSSNNTFNNLKIFNNGIEENGIGYCGIRLYNNSNSNDFSELSIYNNIIGICLNGKLGTLSGNKFEDMKIFNNITTESIVGNLSGLIIKTGTIINTGILQKELTGKIKTGISEILTGSIITKTGLKLSFEYMINPHVKKHYLISWESSYVDNIGFKSDFLDINNDELTYSIGIMLQTEITGHIISNGVNVVSDGNINSYNINGHEYVGNKLRNTLSENINIGDVRNTVATNINSKDIHAMLILDTTSPTCKITYSTTGTTTDNVIAYLTGCSEEIQGTESTHVFTKSGTFTFEFTDLVGNPGYTTATVNRIIQKPSGGGDGGGGGGGGNNDIKPSNNSGDNAAEKKFSTDQSKFDSNYSDEMNMAYQYAYYYEITTQKTIADADMEGGLTRIAMAKMLSQYAINVLGKKPNTNETPIFEDISEALDKEYGNGVTLAYQLGIMGINVDKFRPYDPVTRAEFATALSRLLYGTKDGDDAFYSTHLKKLFDKGIIVNTDPNLQELRGYVMIMLMRSALGISSTEDFVYPEPEPQSQEIVKYFTEPYKKGQIYSRIGDLQDLLRYLGYYKLGTNYVYSKATINAVYDFQVAMGLIDADDVNNPARGYLGPETRNALNEKWAEFQQYKNGIANE